MTNYTKQPDARPWACDLVSGDTLSAQQNRCICHTRLADFGLKTEQSRHNGNATETWRVWPIRERPLPRGPYTML